MEQDAELKVFIASSEPTCNVCGEQLGRGAWLAQFDNKDRVIR